MTLVQVGFSASAVQALMYQNGDYMGSLNKTASVRTVLYNDFRFVLGYRDWPTLNTQWRTATTTTDYY